jgi:DNA-binding ferritin-like protein
MKDKDAACYVQHGVSGYGVATKLSSREAIDSNKLGGFLKELMVEIAERCQKAGAKYIGHIKSHVQTSEGSLRADTIGTKHGAELHGHMQKPVKTGELVINSIVQGITKDEVKDCTLGATYDLAEKYNLQIEKVEEHQYFDEYDYLSRTDKLDMEIPVCEGDVHVSG